MLVNNFTMFCFTFIFCLSVCVTSIFAENDAPGQMSFAVDYENDQFLLDGKPFRYVSGSFHYFRTPKENWRDRLRKMRAAGLNAISTYVEWSLHQPEPKEWVWDGDADLVEFIKLAQEEDLLVLLRPGPYICAEREFGGFPYWLLSLVPDIKLRTNDSRYLKYVEEYLNQVLTKVKPLLRGNGGPIIMVQVENEYGSFYACDKEYMTKLKDIMNHHVGDKAVLYTTDPPNKEVLQCGRVSGAYTTVDFGIHSDVTKYFKVMREFQPKGPLVNSEFYTGWLQHWEEAFPRVDTKNVTEKLDEILSTGASVNIYMFYGGTNFGFTAGANLFDKYAPDLTTYDYDAPLTEAGDPTPKYFEMRKIISKYLPLPNLKEPSVSPKREYGTVAMKYSFKLFDSSANQQPLQSANPPTFEELGISNWLVLYESKVPVKETNATLNATPKDRALVYLDGKLSGTLSRANNISSLVLDTSKAENIKILVENQGRINFGNVSVEDFKGIFNVSLNNVKITPWDVTRFSFNDIKRSYDQFLSSDKTQSSTVDTGKLISGPQVVIGFFNIIGEPRDTYLNTNHWGKGIAIINDHNLGRYWPSAGPQVTLYVPSQWLKEGSNTLVLIELEQIPENRSISFQTTPILDYP